MKNSLTIPFIVLFALGLVGCGTTDKAIETNESVINDSNTNGTLNSIERDTENGDRTNNGTQGNNDTQNGTGNTNGTNHDTGNQTHSGDEAGTNDNNDLYDHNNEETNNNDEDQSTRKIM